MPRLTTGMEMPDFTYDTPFDKGLQLAQTVAHAPATAVLFLRYYGCTLCQLDLHELKAAYPSLAAQGQLLVVLQSSAEGLAEQLTAESFPFAIVCDPTGSMYHALDIQPAASKLALAGPKTIQKVARATAKGFKHGEYEGNELQLPATFVLSPDMTVQYAHYGKQAADIPTTAELAMLLQKATGL